MESPGESWTEAVEIDTVGAEEHGEDEERLILLVETQAGDVIDMMKSNDRARLLRETEESREYAGSVTAFRGRLGWTRGQIPIGQAGFQIAWKRGDPRERFAFARSHCVRSPPGRA